MKYIIDGYNLIHRAGIIDFCDGDITLSRERLESALQRYLGSRKGLAAVIVYDSRRRAATRQAHSPGLSIIFSSGDADSRIASLIEKEKKKGALIVVSTDLRHVIRDAKAYRVNHTTAEKFWDLINRKKPPRKTSSGTGTCPDSSETTAWYAKILREKGKLK